MKRKTQNIILMVLLAIFCLLILTSCGNKKVDYFTYGEKDLGWVGKLVKAMHGWIGSYGWTVVVFTVFLKLIMTPIDLWQRISSRKSSVKMQKIQPLMAEIDKRYGANTKRANEEKQKLYKKQGYSTFSMCLPMILSMVIFFVMFGGLRDYSTYSSVTNFQNLSRTYFNGYYSAIVEVNNDEEYSLILDKYKDLLGTQDAKLDKATTTELLDGIDSFQNKHPELVQDCSDKALALVKEYDVAHRESWLWIQNVWQPDTWATIMPAFNDRSNGFSNSVSGFGDKDGAHYEMIRTAVLQTGTRGESGKWNGLMLLPVFSIGLSFLSVFVSQRMDRSRRKDEEKPQQDAQQAATNKTMMIMMPLMMAFFGFMYTGAFAIYMVCNYALSILSTVAMQIPVEKIVQKSLAKAEKKDNEGKASYMR